MQPHKLVALFDILWPQTTIGEPFRMPLSDGTAMIGLFAPIENLKLYAAIETDSQGNVNDLLVAIDPALPVQDCILLAHSSTETEGRGHVADLTAMRACIAAVLPAKRHERALQLAHLAVASLATHIKHGSVTERKLRNLTTSGKALHATLLFDGRRRAYGSN